MAKPATPSSWNPDWVYGFLLLAATFLAYRPVWSGQPLWDDDVYMTPMRLRSIDGLEQIWTHPSRTVQYYPVAHSVFWMENRLWGQSTLGYHLLGILLHGSCALLLVRTLRRLRIPGAWLAGGIFALHPVMVESVAWITELKNTLSGVLFLCAGLAYLKFDGKRKQKHYTVALVLFLVGLLAKSAIVTLPAALLVMFWWMRGRIEWKRDVVPLLPFFAIGIASGVLTTWVERKFMGAQGTDFGLTPVDRCLIAGRAVWFYLYKLVWPANLIFIYPRWHIDATVVWQYLLPLALLLTAVLFWKLRSRSRAPLAVLLYFAGMLFPVLGFFNIYFTRYAFVADHFQYLAAIGPITAAAALIVKGTGLLNERGRRLAKPLLYGMVLSIPFLLTWKQSGMYSDVETLYRTTIARNNNCALAHNNLGLLLMDKGRTDEAMTHCLKALEADPKLGDAHYNVGLLLAKMGRVEEAMAHYLKALELNADHAKTHNNLGSLLEKQGRVDEAMIHYQKALEANPNHAEARNNLGALLARSGRLDKAMAHFLRVLEINPNQRDAQYNLGILLAKMGRVDEATRHFRKILELDPSHAKSHNYIGVLLAQLGRTDEAMPHFLKALEINPNYGDAHFNLGFLLADMGRGDEAIAHFRKAVEIDPDAIGTLRDRALALAQRGQLTGAASLLKRALALAESVGDEAQAKTIAQILGRL